MPKTYTEEDLLEKVEEDEGFDQLAQAPRAHQPGNGAMAAATGAMDDGSVGLRRRPL